MADKIRGITLEIGGDTSGLNKALKGVNSEIRSTQKELRDVEKLLKLDPHNTELLEQKQKLLGEQIGQTTEKLDALNQLQAEMDASGVEESSDQYMALRREIIETETSLNTLTAQADETAAALDGSGDAADGAADGVGQFGAAASEAEGSTSSWEIAVGNLISNGLEKLVSLVSEAVTGTFELADNVNTLANNYGISASAAYELYQQQELLDYSVQSIARMMKEQYKTLSEGSEAYDALGIAVRGADGELLSQEEIFANTIDYLRSIDDPVRRAAEGTELLGNKYYDLGGILNATDDKYAAFKRGLTSTSAELEDNLDGLQQFKDMIDGVKVVLTDAAVGLGTFFGWLSQLQGAIPAIVTIIGTLTAAWLAFGGVQTLITTAQTIMNAVMMANPLGLIILAVGALVTAFILLWNNCEGFRNFFINMWNTIKTVAINTWNAIKEFAVNAVETLKNAWNGIVEWFTEMWNKITEVFNKAKDLGAKIVEDIKQGIAEKWASLTSWFTGLWDKLFGNRTVNVDVNGTTSGANGAHALGLSSVPYSGYTAMLHKGEAVLTASQADAWRNGGSSGNTINISVTTQEMTAAQTDYLISEVNRRLAAV